MNQETTRAFLYTVAIGVLCALGAYAAGVWP